MAEFVSDDQVHDLIVAICHTDVKSSISAGVPMSSVQLNIVRNAIVNNDKLKRGAKSDVPKIFNAFGYILAGLVALWVLLMVGGLAVLVLKWLFGLVF